MQRSWGVGGHSTGRGYRGTLHHQEHGVAPRDAAYRKRMRRLRRRAALAK
ncbi:MAG: hypothetical protein R3E01_01285 [Pirellulaceae bacterium]|nr:hypothetical protein [Planctomycetales bacterium]